MTLAAVLGNFGWGLVLGFSVAAAGLISVVLLRFSPSRTFSVRADKPRLRVLKGEEAEVDLKVKSPMGFEESDVSLAGAPEGLTLELRRSTGRSSTVVASSRFSGVYRNVKVRLSFPDFLGIAERYEERELELTLEFLPKALLFELARVNMTPLTLGEIPANRMGLAQEFYGAERYNLSQEVKDILWKRLARFASPSPMVRVREANTPELLTVCVLELIERGGVEYYRWMDLVCEAVARVGSAVIGIGVRLRLVRDTRAGRTVAEAHDLESLADCTMAIWQGADQKGTEYGPESATIIIEGEAELNSAEGLSLAGSKPTVVISLGQTYRQQNPKLLVFTGSEDLSGIVGLVLSR